MCLHLSFLNFPFQLLDLRLLLNIIFGLFVLDCLDLSLEFTLLFVFPSVFLLVESDLLVFKFDLACEFSKPLFQLALFPLQVVFSLLKFVNFFMKWSNPCFNNLSALLCFQS